MPPSSSYRPSRIHLDLGPEFFDPVAPAAFPKAILRFRNQEWAARVGLGALTPADWEAHFARFEPLPAAGRELSFSQPVALRYHGHQFRSYNPDLGDGRGFLFAQLIDSENGRLLDLGTKGTGTTPWSRSGDGRLTLKGAVREALATEMLEALGVYTSKTFSVFETGESLQRNDEPSPTRSAALVRLSHGHVRFGTFQRFAFERNVGAIEALVRHCVKHYFATEVGGADRPIAELAPAFLREVVLRSARLAASWMTAGFVHGVLNTDNMNITGESFDYGPYRFLPHYDPEFTAAYFDRTGLYAFGRQPESVLWSLQRLAECLIGIAPEDALTAALDGYAAEFNTSFKLKLFDRMGLKSRGSEEDERLLVAAFSHLLASETGYAQFFHDVYGGGARAVDRGVSSAPAFAEALAPYEASEKASLNLADPFFARREACSLLIDEIEAIWSAISERDDWSKFEAKIQDIRAMRRAYGRDNALDTGP